MDLDEQRRLVDAARTGDHDAWELLYRHVYPRLHAYAAQRTGSSGADDIVNETMTRAVRAIDRFTWQPAGFDGWLFGIARNVILDEGRRARRAVRHMPRLYDGNSPRQPADDLEAGEERVAVRRAFAALGDKEREILELRVIAGLSAEETAMVLGKRPGAVRTAQSRALQRLRDLMEPGRE